MAGDISDIAAEFNSKVYLSALSYFCRRLFIITPNSVSIETIAEEL